MVDTSVINWSSDQCAEWAKRKHLNEVVSSCISKEDLDGKCLLTLTESDIRDLRDHYSYDLKISDIKRFWIAVRCLQRDNYGHLIYLGISPPDPLVSNNASLTTHQNLACAPVYQHQQSSSCELVHHINQHDIERVSPPLSIDGRATIIQPEFFKTTISLGKRILT